MSSLDQVLANFDFHLDKNKIAQAPAIPRDHSKLLLVNRQQNSIKDSIFYQITDYLGDNDVLVLNETKVFPARLLGKKETGGKVELLLLKQLSNNFWEAISKPGLKEGQRLFFLRRESKKALQNGFLELADLEKLEAVVVKREANSAKVEVEFNKSGINLLEEIDACGIMPLPPYIHSKQSENEIRDEYQTVFAKHIGSAAAPTAGLHFTGEVFAKLLEKGVQIEKVTLHVGLGTFAKLTEENIKNKTLHHEFYQMDQETVERLNQAKKSGKRIIAVGTTSTRTLEAAVLESQSKEDLVAGARDTNIFIDPPYQFNFVDALITNFHLPQSSLLMLVSALVSHPNTEEKFTNFQDSLLGKAYQHALDNDYRFFSFGDAMFIS
jgi:S-adenosylmethionine:tRNA ribosyltransferase-isomerase